MGPFIPDPTRTGDGWATQAGEQIAAAGEAADREAAEGSPAPLATSPAPAPDEGDQVTDEDIAAVAKAFARFATHCGSGRPHPRAVQQTIVRVIPEVE